MTDTPTSENHEQAIEWARKYVNSATKCTIMPKSRNMAVCYLDVIRALEEAKEHMNTLMLHAQETQSYEAALAWLKANPSHIERVTHDET